MICSSACALGTASSRGVGKYFKLIDDCLGIAAEQEVMILMCKWSPLSLGGFVPNTLPEINSSQMKMATQKERLAFPNINFLGQSNRVIIKFISKNPKHKGIYMGYNSFHNSNGAHPVGGFQKPVISFVRQGASGCRSCFRCSSGIERTCYRCQGFPGFLPVFWDMKTWIRF